MLTALSLLNFKAWSGSVDVPLAPITMLLGANSSGKSSLIQALLLLKQTVASPDRSVQLNLGGGEVDYFNFGQFNDVLSKDAQQRSFGLGFGFTRTQPNDPEELHWVESGDIQVRYVMTSSGATAIEEMTIKSENEIFTATRREKGAYSISANGESIGKSRSYAPERSIAFSVDAIRGLRDDGLMADEISYAIRQELDSIAYLGPLRRKPERDYVWNKTMPGGLNSDGSNVSNALFSSALLHTREENRTSIIDGVSEWLRKMGVANRIEIRRLGASNRYEIIVEKDGVSSNLRDVGIGISQVLPVLTLAFFAPYGSTILLEEPEIHLHPQAQTLLAELFVEVSKKRKIQFIVETHSEHIFRRMQTLIAKQKIRQSDCVMYFVERKRCKAKLTALAVDEFGRVTNWPVNFFGDALGETREQARMMFERQSRK